MTWGQFKSAVEEQGIMDHDTVWFVDCAPGTTPEMVMVLLNDAHGAAVLAGREVDAAGAEAVDATGGRV